MAYNEGQMSGSSDYRCGINVYLVSQNAGGNTSTFYWEVRLVIGGTSWFADNTGTWSASLAGGYYTQSGNWNLPSANRYDAVKYLAAAYYTAGHDADGFRPGMANSAYASAPHSAIGAGGSGDAWVDAPRIPKTPVQGGSAPVASMLTANSMRITWPGASDDRGAAIDAYLLRVSKNSNPEVAYTDYGASAGQRHIDLAGLEPNTTYYWYVYPRNSVGYGNPSPKGQATTLAGVYVSDGTKWVATSINCSDGSAWSTPLPKISDGDSWENPIDQ